MTQLAEASTRERLLDAAWLVIRESGLRAATSREITTRAGANLGAITYYFGSKSALITAAAVTRMALWTEPLSAALSADEIDPAGRTMDLIPLLLEMLVDAEQDVRAMLELVVTPDADPRIRTALRGHLSEFQSLVAGILSARQARGEVPPSVHAAAMAGLCTAVALGLMTQHYIGSSSASVPAMVAELLGLFEVAAQRPSEQLVARASHETASG